MFLNFRNFQSNFHKLEKSVCGTMWPRCQGKKAVGHSLPGRSRRLLGSIKALRAARVENPLSLLHGRLGRLSEQMAQPLSKPLYWFDKL